MENKLNWFELSSWMSYLRSTIHNVSDYSYIHHVSDIAINSLFEILFVDATLYSSPQIIVYLCTVSGKNAVTPFLLTDRYLLLPQDTSEIVEDDQCSCVCKCSKYFIIWLQIQPLYLELDWPKKYDKILHEPWMISNDPKNELDIICTTRNKVIQYHYCKI